MNLAPKEQVGLALGAWGAIQASAAGLAVASSGILRDVVSAAASGTSLPLGLSGPSSGYTVVYVIEILLLVATIVVIAPLVRRGPSPAVDVMVPEPVTSAIEQR
jgi:BCD family chlorophyll transporter-like MFS transporter